MKLYEAILEALEKTEGLYSYISNKEFENNGIVLLVKYEKEHRPTYVFDNIDVQHVVSFGLMGNIKESNNECWTMNNYCPTSHELLRDDWFSLEPLPNKYNRKTLTNPDWFIPNPNGI